MTKIILYNRKSMVSTVWSLLIVDGQMRVVCLRTHVRSILVQLPSVVSEGEHACGCFKITSKYD